MNADRMFALYDRVAEAPYAVSRLRRYVLDLAMRGKLVEQDPADEPAAYLLKRIELKKQELVKAKIIRKPKLLPDLDPSRLPFTLPRSWSWTRIDDLSPRSLTDGDWIERKDQSEDGRVRLIQLADVGVGAFLDKSARFVTEETEVRLRCTRLAVGDILIARLPNPIGRACIFPDIGQPAITAVDVAILRPDRNSSNNYLEIAINAPSTREQVEAYGKGATRFRVSTGHLKTIVLPLPPLAEQRRIVAKVDELLALCDQLEEARTAREDTRDRLTKASMTRLNIPDTDVPTFRSHARFAVNALPALTARADQVNHLRQTILSLAVRGKLVEQDPSDEPASVLLRRISAVRTRLVKAGKIKPRKLKSRLRRSPVEFARPRGWELTDLSSTSLKITDGAHKTPTYVGSGVPFVSVKDFSGGRLDLSNTRFIPRSEHEMLYRRCDPRRGDILLARIGTLGKAVIVDTDLEFSLFVSVALIRFDQTNVYPHYSQIVLNSPLALEEFNRIKVGGATHTNKLNLGDLHTVAFPLPPLAEQRRIVARVNELMALCDQLEGGLDTASSTRRHLLDALLNESLGPHDATVNGESHGGARVEA